MFYKKVRKTFPPGTFIPTPARLAAIVQLCLAFTLLAWQGSLPFMGELFATKYKLLVYQHLMGKKIDGHATRFASLPEKTQILKEYELLQRDLETSFLAKIKRAVTGLWNLPLFEKAWIFFAILLPILLLKRVEGAAQIVWILPILALAYGLDNRIHGLAPRKTAEERLFPSEERILQNYVGAPLKPSIIEQQKQLQLGWQTYLIKEWAKEEPSQDEQQFLHQAEKGDFAFNLARIKALKEPRSLRPKQEPISLLALYLFWNLSFALIVTKSLKQSCVQVSY